MSAFDRFDPYAFLSSRGIERSQDSQHSPGDPSTFAMYASPTRTKNQMEEEEEEVANAKLQDGPAKVAKAANAECEIHPPLRVFSRILDEEVWLVCGDDTAKELEAEGALVFTYQEVLALEGMLEEDLQEVARVKRGLGLAVGPGSRVRGTNGPAIPDSFPNAPEPDAANPHRARPRGGRENDA